MRSQQDADAGMATTSRARLESSSGTPSVVPLRPARAEYRTEVAKTIPEHGAVLHRRSPVETDGPDTRLIRTDAGPHPPAVIARSPSCSGSPLLYGDHLRGIFDHVALSKRHGEEVCEAIDTFSDEVDDPRSAISRDHSVTRPPARWA